MRGKSLIVTLVTTIVVKLLVGQTTDWRDLINQPNPNYYKVVEAYQKQYQGKELLPHNGHKQFERWAASVAPRVNEDGSIRPMLSIMSTREEYFSKNSSRSTAGNWLEIGPWTEKNVYRGVGRLTCMAFDPKIPEKFYVGTPAGGIWMTEDDGKTWRNLDDDLANFGVSSIVIDPNNTDVIYAGSGDIDANESDGTGVWKSIDGGDNWIRKDSGMGDVTIGKLLMAPGNPQRIYAAAKNGIYITTDGGESWTQKLTGYDMRDIEVKPNNPNVLYASNYTTGLGALIFVSKDAGETWDRKFVDQGLFPDWRYELAVTKANPNLLMGVGGRRIVSTINEGDSFKIVTTEGNQLLDRNERQGWYNASFEIDPTNADNMFVGNVQKYRSTDGGKRFLMVRHTHADNHYIVFSPHNNDLYVLDDGGIHRSKDGGYTFEDLTNFGNAAIYRVAQSPFNVEHTLTGYQDCGSKYYDGYTWHSVYGADGMQPLYDHTDSNRFYTSYQYGRVVRFLKHIGSGQVLPAPEKPSDAGLDDYRGPWVTPFTLDGLDNQTLYVGWDRVWRCKNLFVDKTKNIVWEEASSGPGKHVGGQFVRLKLDRSNPKRMYAQIQNSSRNRINLVKTEDITAQNPVWVDMPSGTPTGTTAADFETDPRDSSIYLLFRNRVHHSDYSGTNWVDITYNLPNVPMHVIEMDTTNSDLYVGSHAGVFYKAAGDTVWQSFSNGLTRNARVRDLDIYYSKDHKNSRLKAATYGRGLWESDLYGSHAGNQTETMAYITSEQDPYTFEADFEVMVSFRKHINERRVSGFDQNDLIVQNAQIISLNSSGDHFVVKLKADSLGAVTVEVPEGAATDVLSNSPTGESMRWKVNYIKEPTNIGPYGPGGVGDSNSLRLWMRADHIMTNKTGDTITVDEDRVSEWFDFSGNNYVAVQGTDSSMPYFRTAENGINGWPAIEYRPPNRFFWINNVTPVGENMSAFAVAVSNTDNWTGHSWIANSREDNGFLIHVNNNNKSVYGVVCDDERRYLGTPSLSAWDVTEPHVFGMRYTGGMWRNSFHLDDQVSLDNLFRDYERDGKDTINIRIGKDYRERYGDGKLGELIYYNDDVFEARRLIVSNYLASKYGVDLKDNDLFAFDPEFSYEVAGIGRISEIDFHEAAKGTGLLLIEGDRNQMADQSFMLWGHNNEDLSWASGSASLQPDLLICKRVWRTDVNGSGVGTVKLSFKASELPGVSKNLAILVSQSADFSSPFTYQLQRIGDRYETTISGLSNGDYIGIAQADEFYIGVAEAARSNKVRLLPNPAIDGVSYLKVWSEYGGEISVSVVDQLGRSLIEMTKQVNAGEYNIRIDLQHNPSGVYLINVSGEGFRDQLKLIK